MMESNIDVTVTVSKRSIREILESNREANKREDVKRLEEVLESICRFEEGEIINIKDVFRKIGELCEEITHNDKGDSGLYVIKNEYGYIRRSKDIKNNKQVNKCGLYFEKFSQFKTYLEQEHLYQPISDDHLEDLRTILLTLKTSVVHILKKENYLIHKQRTADEIRSVTEDKSLPVNISRVSDVYYNKIVLDRMSKELELVERINYDSIDGRYLFARVFTILGDLANDLVEDRINPTNNLVAALKNLFSIRSKIIHCFKKIQNDDSESIRINEGHISLVKDNLNIWISKFRGREGECLEIDNDDQPDVYQTLKNETNVLLKYFKYRPKRPMRESMPKQEETAQKIEDNLNYLISVADKVIHQCFDDNPNNNEQTILNKLNRLNNFYLSEINKLERTSNFNFPDALSWENRSKINKHLRMNLLISTPEKNKIKLSNPYLERKILDINKEMEYLESVESNRKIGHVEKEHIIEQICLEVTQYVREVEYGIVLPDFKIEDLHGQKDFPYESLLKKVLKESADNASFFTYLYTNTDLLNHPSISHIMMCNIGVSFAKLRLYEEASFYLEKSYNGIESFCEKLELSRHSNMGDVRPDGRIPNYFFIENFGIEWYQLFIHRAYAKVLTLKNAKDKAQTLYDETFEKFRFDNIKNCADQNFQSSITNFLIDFVNYLMDKREFQRAIEITNQALTLSDDLQLRIILIEALCKSNDFERAKELCDKILVDCRDVFLKMRVLQRLVEIYVSCTDADCGTQYARVYLGEMDRLFQSENESLFETFNMTYKLTKLKIKYGELVLFINDRRSESDLDNFENIERECKDLIDECRRSEPKDPIVAIILMIFCWIYSPIGKCSSENNHFNNLSKAKTYFIEIAKEIDDIPNACYLRKKVRRLVQYLSIGCSTIRTSDDEIVNSEFFVQQVIECFNLQKAYNVNMSSTINKLSYEYEKLAQQYVSRFNDNTPEDNFKGAFNCFKNIRMLKNLETAKPMTSFEHQTMKEYSIDSIRIFASLCKKWAERSNDWKYMKPTVKCYEVILTTSVPVNEMVEKNHKIESLKKKIEQYIDFLRKLLEYNGPIANHNFDQKIIDFYSNKFNITLRSENGSLIWDNHHDANQRDFIQSEFDNISG